MTYGGDVSGRKCMRNDSVNSRHRQCEPTPNEMIEMISQLDFFSPSHPSLTRLKVHYRNS